MKGPSLYLSTGWSMDTNPWWLRVLAEANPWVVVLGGVVGFFLARSLVQRFFFFLAQHMAVGFKAIWEFLSGREDP